MTIEGQLINGYLLVLIIAFALNIVIITFYMLIFTFIAKKLSVDKEKLKKKRYKLLFFILCPLYTIFSLVISAWIEHTITGTLPPVPDPSVVHFLYMYTTITFIQGGYHSMLDIVCSVLKKIKNWVKELSSEKD